MAASSQTLNKLHESVALLLVEIITEGVPWKWNDEGEVIAHRKASAAEIGAAIKMLKDNEITADIEENDALAALKETMERKRKTGRPIIDDLLADGDYVQ